jgi:hypothetical protein
MPFQNRQEPACDTVFSIRNDLFRIRIYPVFVQQGF